MEGSADHRPSVFPSSSLISAAKITRPLIQDAVLRPRLFHRIERSSAKLIWIGGPPGSGKTVLAATYADYRGRPCTWLRIDRADNDPASFFLHLTHAATAVGLHESAPLPMLAPEQLPTIVVFARLYFRALFQSRGEGFMLVLDDCHELPDESPVLDLFPLLLQEIPPGTQVLALSRRQTPPALARGLANREVAELGAQDLTFTLDEAESILAQPQSSIDKAMASRLHGVTQGWAAGLVLHKMLLERREFGSNDLNRVVPGRIQEYFETEVIKALPASEAELLIKTAWLPYLTHATAFHVTASPETGDLIARLARKGLFVTEHQQDVSHFSYHPLFHRVLQTLAQHFLSKNDVAATRYRAAQALEDSGDIESAIESWLSLQEFEQAARLIVAQAPKVLGQARFATLGRWLKVLPQEVRRKSPWILYWEGMCFGSIKPDVALESFDAAFHLFKNENNLTGMALACCGAMEAIYLDWKDFKRLDPWIEAFEPIYEPWAKTVPPDLALRGAADMLGSLMWRTPDHPRIGQWRELTKALLHKTEDPTAQGLAMTHLLCFHTWKGELDEAEQLANETIGTSGEATLSPVWIIGRMCFKTIICWNKGSYDIGENYVTQTLAYACETGVHVADHHILAQGLYNSLLSGDRTKADHYQKQFAAILNPAHPFIEAHFHHLVSWAAWLQGNTDDAWRHSRIALRGAQQAGTPFPIALNHMPRPSSPITVGCRNRLPRRSNEPFVSVRVWTVPF